MDSRYLLLRGLIPGKGKCYFAAAAIPRGTRVLCESPLLSTPSQNFHPEEIITAFENLSTVQRTAYLSLHSYLWPNLPNDRIWWQMAKKWNKYTALEQTALWIWSTNSFGNVYHLGSRFNHSCLPNMCYSNNRALGMGTFHAIRDIEEGEELTLSYIDEGIHMRKDRQYKLQQYGFECTYPCCEDTDVARQRERQRFRLYGLGQLLEGQEELGNFKDEEDEKKTLEIAASMAGIMEIEGLPNERLRHMYHTAAKYSWRLGERRMALAWARKDLDILTICAGEDDLYWQDTWKVIGLMEEVAERSGDIHPLVMMWLKRTG